MTRSRARDEFPQLAPLGLEACGIRGDGNCLFNALSDQIYGHQEKNAEIRKTCVQHMRENPEAFKPFLTVGQGSRRNPKRKNVGTLSSQSYFEGATVDQTELAWQEYLHRKAQNGIYGDQMEITAFAKAYKTDVKIFRDGNSHYIRADDNDATIRPVAYIAYHEWEHYSSVRNTNGPFTGLPQLQVEERQLSTKEEAHTTESLPECDPIDITTPTTPVDVASLPKVSDESSDDVTVNKIVETGYLGSDPPSPGSSSLSGSYSIERDADSDDDDSIYGPNKRQPRLVDPSSPGSSILSGNSSTERDSDSDDGELYNPKRGQRRRIARASRPSLKIKGHAQVDVSGPPAIPAIEPTLDDSEISGEVAEAGIAKVKAPTRKAAACQGGSRQKQLGPQEKSTARERKPQKKAARRGRKPAKKTPQPQPAISTTTQDGNRRATPSEQIGMKTLHI